MQVVVLEKQWASACKRRCKYCDRFKKCGGKPEAWRYHLYLPLQKWKQPVAMPYLYNVIYVLKTKYKAVVDQAVDRFGGIDILINNASAITLSR